MVKKIRLILDYGCYPVWLYDENGNIVDTLLPDELRSDRELDSKFDMPCSLIINTNSLLLVSITMMSVMHFFEIGEMLMMSLLKKPMAGIQLLTR